MNNIVMKKRDIPPHLLQYFHEKKQNRWCLRNKIVWYKPNCMPSSAKDRFTVDWEYVYFFTKSQKYFFETQYEPLQPDTKSRHDYQFSGSARAWRHEQLANRKSGYHSDNNWKFNPLGRIKRCVFKQDTPYMRLRKDLSEEQKKDVIGKLLERGLI